MKISASIYSNTTDELTAVIKDLDDHDIDMFHVDCNDNPSVFEDIRKIREISRTPIDLHLITSTPENYFSMLKSTQVEYVTFQHENLTAPLSIPEGINSKLGIAITSDTDIDVFDQYADQFDFILFMATIPGQSGGKFDKNNFKKIRAFRKRYPGKKIHVDGGVNEEVSFILRNMGVYSSVSGSYLFNANSIGSALLSLKSKDTESHYVVKDFMRPKGELELPSADDRSVSSILKSIESNKLGFTLLIKSDGKLEGLVSNADIRKGLIKNIEDFNQMKVDDIVNRKPISINENATVLELLKVVKSYNFPVSYLPVVDNNNVVTGVVTFVNLIKGEL